MAPPPSEPRGWLRQWGRLQALEPGSDEVTRITYECALSVGEGALWSADRQSAWLLSDGEKGRQITLEEAREITARIGVAVPGEKP